MPVTFFFKKTLSIRNYFYFVLCFFEMLEMLHQALNQVKTQLFCCKSLRIKKKIGVVSKYLYILLYPDKHLFGEQLR